MDRAPQFLFRRASAQLVPAIISPVGDWTYSGFAIKKYAIQKEWRSGIFRYT
jgi:hypothetical protein